MANDKFTTIFSMMQLRLCALSYDHWYTSKLLAQREHVLERVRARPTFKTHSYPFLPVFWSADPKRNAHLNLTSVLREDMLLRELASMHDVVDIPKQPYFIFGVDVPSPWISPETQSMLARSRPSCGLTAAETTSTVFFTDRILWRPSTSYAVCGSAFADGSMPILGFVNGHLTFHAIMNDETVTPTLIHRECFLA